MVALGLIAVLGSGGLTLHWRLAQQALEREGNLAMIERLRRNQPADAGIGPTGSEVEGSSTGTAVEPTAAGSAPGNQLAITTMPNTATTLEPITIPLPVSSDVMADAAPADQSAAVAHQPMLVGVVQGGSGNGSAIFKVGDLSLSTVPGELIGNSGWTLLSVSASGAVIERAGATQSLSIGGAF